MYGLRGLGALIPCLDGSCINQPPGYYYYSDSDRMVSSYRLSIDPATAPYTIAGTSYWYRRDGRDSNCQNLGANPPACSGAAVPPPVVPVSPAVAAPPVVVTIPPQSPAPQSTQPLLQSTGFDLSSIPAWAWAAGAGVALFALSRR